MVLEIDCYHDHRIDQGKKPACVIRCMGQVFIFEQKEAEDHLCMELECMAYLYLCMLLGNRLKAGAYDEARRIMDWQNDLLSAHLLQ